MVSPKAKRKALSHIREKFRLSVRQGCRILGLHESTFYHRSKRVRDDEPLKKAILELVTKKSYFGFPMVFSKLREQQGFKDNHKRIRRIYREMGLQIGKRMKSRKVQRPKLLLAVPTQPNELWAMDFVLDSFSTGRRFRTLTVKDLYTHEALVLHVDHSITGEGVAGAIDRLGRLPKGIVCDNGSEFVSKAMDQWSYRNGVELKFIQPGKPTQNAFIESFNGRFRAECLNQNWFENLDQARSMIEAWRLEYNTERPNKAIGRKTPDAFAKEQERLLYG